MKVGIILITYLISFNAFSLSNNNDYVYQDLFLLNINKKDFFFEKERHEYFKLEASVEVSKKLNELNSLFEDDTSEEQIINFLDKNYGNDYLIKTNNYVSIKGFDLEIQAGISGGALLYIDNPVVPEVGIKMMQDNHVSFKKTFRNNNTNITLTLIIGKRKLYNEIVGPKDFLKEEKYKFKWDEHEFNDYMDLALDSRHSISSKLEIKSSIQGVSLKNKDSLNYWRTNLGMNYFIMKDFLTSNIWFKFSPIYSGSYSYDHLIEYGLSNSLFEIIDLDIFYKYKGFNTKLTFDFKLFELSGIYSNPKLDPNGANTENYSVNVSIKW